VKRFSAEEVLSLPPDGDLASLLRTSEANLTENLRLFSGQPGACFLEDDRGVRFLNRIAPPDSLVLMTRWPAAEAEECIDGGWDRAHLGCLDSSRPPQERIWVLPDARRAR
jgi:hypothetical protein